MSQKDPRYNMYDPQQVLMQQKQFAEQHGISLSPYPKRIITPEESAEKNVNRLPTGYENYVEDLKKAVEEPQEKELLIMTIEIGDGKKDTLRVFENDDPNELAKAFCQKHGLNPNIIYPLAQNIYNNMEQVLQERLDALNYGVNEYNENKSIQDDAQKFPEQQTGAFNADHLHDSTSQQELPLGARENDQKYTFETADSKTNDYPYQGNSPNENQSQEHGKENVPYAFPQQNGSHFTLNNENESRRYSTSKKGNVSPNKLNVSHRKTPDRMDRRHNSDYPSDQQIKKSIYYPEHFQTEEEYIDHLIENQLSGNTKQSGPNTELTFVPQINPNSKLILESKYQNNRISVYDRLHNHAKLKLQKSKQNLSPRKSATNNTTQHHISSQSSSGLKRKEEMNKILTDKRKEMIEKQEKECTFHPNINPISNEIMNNKPRYEPTEEALIKNGKALKDKIERARSLKKIQEIEECTFKPTINSISERIIQEKEKMIPAIGKNRFLRLYHDSKVRQAQQEVRSRAYHDECTFTPAITNYHSSSIEQTTFEQRIQKFKEKQAKIEQMREEKYMSELIDPETGRPFFHPQVGRPPRTNRNTGGQSIGEYLYNQRLEIENRQRSLYEKELRTQEANMARSNEKSHQIIENIKRKKLCEIFKLLDSDGDGYISSTKIDIASVGTDILEAFAPLLCEMEELNQTLSLQEFIEAAEKLLKTLTVAERDKLLLGKREHEHSLQAQGYTFHPEINKRSAKIAESIRPYGNFDALYEIYIGEKKATEERLQMEKARREEEELRECSFKPVLISQQSVPMMSMNNGDYYANNLY